MALHFPVAVTMPSGAEYRPAKVYAHDDVVDVYVWDRTSHAAELVESIAGALEPAGYRQWAVESDAGRVRVAATGGCGCGHPLKRWSPPRPIRS